MTESVSIAGLPALTWQGQPLASAVDPRGLRLSITAHSRTDWFNDPSTGGVTANAPALLFVPEGDFALSARVSVGFTGTFDAGVLCLWQNREQWAKLCFEHSPQREAMVVSVVTRGLSDDANSAVIQGESVYLRVLRTGNVYAFHYSLNGSHWHFVRLFHLGSGTEPMRAGFLAQAPDLASCTSTFEKITLHVEVPSDLRNGD